MALDILVGLQWGDEGKGKIVDFLSNNYDIIARFQGGPNAGHTIEFGDNKFILHLIPSGIFNEDVINVIGNGVVFDPVEFLEEVDQIRPFVNKIRDKILLSDKAHLILPTHKALDAAIEKFKAENKIGTTLRGISPTYTDKFARNGLRLGDIFANDFYKRFYRITEYHQRLLEEVFNYGIDLNAMVDRWLDAIEELKNYKIISTEYFLNQALNKGKKILAEGAQGTMLDIDFGTYPFVTSSNTISAGANIGLGIPYNKVNKVIGVFKSYTTRVGAGIMPTELTNHIGEMLQQKGSEYGATTGRPRRCGWLDLIVLKYTTMINGVSELAITKTDVLTGFKQILAAVGYEKNGEKLQNIPYNWQEIKPIYKEFEAWQQDISQIERYDDLPQGLKKYISFIEEFLSLPIRYISTGSKRSQLITK